MDIRTGIQEDLYGFPMTHGGCAQEGRSSLVVPDVDCSACI